MKTITPLDDVVLAQLPVFPLPSVVLFPGTVMPLHIFEPRYRALVDDALEGHGCLALAGLVGPKAEVGADPTFCSVAGLGTIIEHQRLPGGRYNVLVMGRGRVALTELPKRDLYRRASAQLLPDDEEAVGSQVEISLVALHGAAASFVKLIQKREPKLRTRLPKDAGAGAVADAYADQLLLSASERQQVLETISVVERVHLVTQMLEVQRIMLEPKNKRTLN